MVASKIVGTQHDREVEANPPVSSKLIHESKGYISSRDRPEAAALWKEVYFKTLEKTGYPSTAQDAANTAVNNTYGK